MNKLSHSISDRPWFVFDGDCGFCRRWVAYWKQLVQEKANVVVVDNLIAGSKENLEEVMDQITFIEKDILDTDFHQLLTEHKINYIFNLAAEPFIPDSYERPSRFMEINTMACGWNCLPSSINFRSRILNYSFHPSFFCCQKNV